MTDVGGSDPRPSLWRRIATRLHLRKVLTTDVLVLAALSGLALTQPLLDLFGRNPEFFVAQDASTTDIVVFALVVTFAVPLGCLVVELVAYAIGDAVGRVVHVLLVAGLATTLGLSLANQLGFGSLAYLAITLGVGVGLTVAVLRVRAVETVLRYMSGALILFLVAFLFFSRTGELLSAEDAEAATGVGVGNPAPVVIVQLDALPVASLMDVDGELNAERFPGFARLGEGATWFRNATSVSQHTTQSVPAGVTGQMPTPGALPTSSDHPDNLFTLLGEDYDLLVNEQVTDLCPAALCVEEGTQAPERSLARTKSLLRDATVVLGHRTLPPFLTDDLPDVDKSWGGFLADDTIEDAPVGSGSSAGGSRIGSSQPGTASSKWNALGPEGWTPQSQSGVISDQIDSLQATAEPTLWYSHGVFPHAPWQLDQNGLEYVIGGRTTAGLEDNKWVQDEWVVRQGFQRHLLQVGYADALIGRLVDKLQAEGMWEDALVVVMADHGLSFVPGTSPRAPEEGTEHEIYNVPLFIKAPGSTEGQVSDDNALLIDVLPSIVDLLDIETDWAFDGRSLFGDTPEPPSKPVYPGEGPEEVPVDPAGLMEVVERNQRRLPYGDDAAAIAAVGELGRFVGRQVDDLDVIGPSDVRWSVDQAAELADWRPEAAGFVPLLWKGQVTMPDGGPPPPELLAVVNGRVAGVASGFGVFEHAADEYSAVINGETLVEGANEVSLLLPVAGGSSFEQARGPS